MLFVYVILLMDIFNWRPRFLKYHLKVTFKNDFNVPVGGIFFSFLEGHYIGIFSHCGKKYNE